MWVQDAAPGTPSLQAQAAIAVGALRLPGASIRTSPPTMAIVNLETFFAPATPLPASARGSSALGLVAIATPQTWVIDLGDGSGVLTCPATVTMPPTSATTAPSGCGHTYRRSSAGQTGRAANGQPAYTVRTHSTWTIRFEQAGRPIAVPGAPTTLNGPVSTSLLPVAEIQALVD
jgi:hypothetical protein